MGKVTHGMTRSAEYRAWMSMLMRCYNPAFVSYKSHGARGIGVCDRWRHSFVNFLADMGPRPEGMTLERRKNDEGYSPDNCEWATRLTQGRNTRRVVLSLEAAAIVRDMHANGIPSQHIAAMLDVSRGAVTGVIYNNTWKEE